MLAEVAVTLVVVPGVLAISKKVKGVTPKQVPLWPCILLQVGVLIGGEVLVVGGNVVMRAEIMQV